MAVCEICLDEAADISLRSCCGTLICATCMEMYILTRLLDGHLRMPCPSGICKVYLEREEINQYLSQSNQDMYQRFFDAANTSPTKKTCPTCSHVTEVTEDELKTASKRHGLQVNCAVCKLTWCFSCHAPQHPELTCQQYRAGDLLLRQWAKEEVFGHSRRARKCPRCKIFIERIEGCDQMDCSRCGKKFCYACGRSRRSLSTRFFKIFDHDSKYSVFGCSKYLFPNRKHVRRLVRVSVLVAEVVVGVPLAISAAAVAVGAVAGIGLAVVTLLPVVAGLVGIGYGIYKLYKLLLYLKSYSSSYSISHSSSEPNPVQI